MLNKKKIAALAAVPLFAVSTSVITATPAEAAVNCTDRGSRTVKAHDNDGSTGNDDWYFKATVKYRYCKTSTGVEWVKPRKAILSYNFEGTFMECSYFKTFNVLQKVLANGYHKDAAGRAFNPSTINIGCDESTENSVTQTYTLSKTSRLYWVKEPGHTSKTAPSFSYNFRTDKSDGYFNATATPRGSYYRVSL